MLLHDLTLDARPARGACAPAPAPEAPAAAMRIAYVINSLEAGGAATPVPPLVQVMRDCGAEVTLFALSHRDQRAVPIYAAADLSWASFPGLQTDHLGAGLWLWDQLRGYQPTHIWTSLTQATVIGQVVGALLGRPVVSWQHNVFLKPANHHLLRATRNLTALWVADSDCVAEVTQARLQLRDERVAVWSIFQADPNFPQSKPWRPGQVFRLGSLGRLHADKGYDLLLEALARLEAVRPSHWPEFEVAIGGDGPERDALWAQASALNLRRLRMAGYQHDPGAFLAGLHGYLQPSRVEGFCIAVHEAMQAALPVVVADVGEMPRTVRSGAMGYVASPNDPEGLANAIGALLDDPARAQRMGQAARTHVLETFSRERFRAAGRDILARMALRQVA